MKSILAKTQHQFNIACAEVDYQDIWQTALLGFCTIGQEAETIRRTLQQVETYIDQHWLEIELLDAQIELY